MYFIRLDISEAKDEPWYVIWHNLLRNPSKTGTRKAHIGRWSRRQRLKVGPIHLKEFSVPSGIHPLLYMRKYKYIKYNAKFQVSPGDMSSFVFAAQHSHRTKGCRAGSSLPKNKLPAVWSVRRFKREVEVVSRHLLSLPIVLHLPCLPRTTKDPRNPRGKEPIFNITFPFHAMKPRKRY